MLGSDKLKDTLYRQEIIDPFEGTRAQGGNPITRYTIKPDPLRSILIQLINDDTRQKWFVPRGTTLEYQKQVTALEKRGGKWENKRRDEHAFDCEVLQIFGALRLGIFRNAWIEDKQRSSENEADSSDN